MPGRKVVSFEKDRRNNMDICSWNEKKFDKMCRTKPEDMAVFHQRYFSRLYPSGTRLLSSNYNPMNAWMFGCQMAALNFQAPGLATLLNVGKFLENGNSGYVLKPEILRVPGRPFNPNNPDPSLLQAAQENPVELTVQVLAGQQLPRADSELQNKKDTCCPFVVITLQGIKSDCLTYRTPYVLNNGLNPRWTDQIFSFEVTVPSLSILVFEVRQYDPVRTEFVAGAAVPVNCIRGGVRWVALYDAKLREIPWAGLLVRVTVRPSKRPMATPKRGSVRRSSSRYTPRQTPDKVNKRSATRTPSSAVHTSTSNNTGKRTMPSFRSPQRSSISRR